eukprot:295834-Amphidinium_carterae.2
MTSCLVSPDSRGVSVGRFFFLSSPFAVMAAGGYISEEAPRGRGCVRSGISGSQLVKSESARGTGI